jgi:integrase/recombinase XerD
MKAPQSLSPLLTKFFSERLIRQKNASSHTIGSYRDTFRLLLEYANTTLLISPVNLLVTDIDSAFIDGFLDHLEGKRGISARSRNLRLTAIRSFFRFIAYELPDHSGQIQQVLAIPSKKHIKKQVNYLTRPESEALLMTPNQLHWIGRRDHAWLMLALQTGARVSEFTALTRSDLHLGTGSYVHITGKGRKERCTPLTQKTKQVLQQWIKDIPESSSQYLFPSSRGTRLSSDGVQYRLKKYVTEASKHCASLASKRVSPHVLRHAAAMELLHAGVDVSVIALWLGHESIETTHIYLQADMKMREEALAKTTPFDGNFKKYKPDDVLMSFLKSL